MLVANVAMATGYYTIGNYRYFVDSYYETASVIEYLGNEEDVAIPNMVFVDGKSYPVISLESKSFYDKDMASVNIPSSIKKIESRCFYGCSSLVSIKIPSSVIEIGEKCFMDCVSLDSVDISSSVTELEDCCFQNCKSLLSVNIT